MASGNLSPRQKMINMMYLVLTALLALNVSAEILESFQQIADSLRESAAQFDAKNKQLGEDIKQTIEQNKNAKDMKFLPLIDVVRNKTGEVIGKIEGYRKELFKKEIAGTLEGTENSSNPKLEGKGEQEKNYRFWMGGGGEAEEMNEGRGKGAALELRKQLNDFVLWAQKFYDEHKPKGAKDIKFKLLAQDPKDFLEDIPDNKELRGKPWEYYTFHGMPAVANLAILEKFKMDLRVIESELLQMIRSQLNQLVFKLDKIQAMEAPEAASVLAGLQYKTKLFVGASSNEAKPKFGSSAGRIEYKPDGSAILTIGASAAAIPKGKDFGIQNYTASVTIAKADGSDTTMTLKGSFRVLKPAVTTKSIVTNKVYRNCLNTSEIDVPGLGELYNPDLQAIGGTVQVSKTNRRQVVLIPSGGGNKMVVKVSSITNGQKIFVDDVEYGVTDPPRPNLLASETAPVVDKGTTVRLRIVPDKDFAAMYVKDASYKFDGGEVLRARGLGNASPVGSIPGTAAGGHEIQLNFSSYGAQRGDSFAFVLNGVSRVNFQGSPFKEKFGKSELTFQFTVK